MAHPFENTSIDNQAQKDEIEEGRKVDHLIDIKDLENLSIKRWSISKVNVWLRESNPAAYTPKMVSIGPYHKENPQLDSMEKYKRLYLRRFLQRKEGLNVESCISELEKLKKEALECYEDMKDLDTKMLLLDGCFVVEFIREHFPKGQHKIINSYDDYIFRDLILLENQLPFFVLKKLYGMTKQDDDDEPLAKLVSKWFPSFVDFPVHYEPFKNIKHLLHLVHKYSCQGIPEKNSDDDKACHGNTKKESNDEMVMPNATELSEAGVSFAKASDRTSLFDIKFENGEMTIPCFRVEDDTEALLRNLIAYEQQSSDVYATYFSDYAVFMDKLIESDKDVNLLCQKKIIMNWLGDDKEVSSLFNKMGNGVSTYADFYYKKEFRKANEHCEKPWNKTKASLKHNYFSSPWVGASTVAAIILLILTTIQTILAFTGSFK